MKKLILTLLLVLGTVAHADGHHRGYYGGLHGENWVAPLMIGGLIVYEATRPPQTVIIQQTPQPVIVHQLPPVGYHWTQIVDASCNCYKVVLVPN